MKRGPGWMPWMIMAPSIDRGDGVAGNAEGHDGHSEPATLELLDDSER
jgi:hypothetical protein